MLFSNANYIKQKLGYKQCTIKNPEGDRLILPSGFLLLPNNLVLFVLRSFRHGVFRSFSFFLRMQLILKN